MKLSRSHGPHPVTLSAIIAIAFILQACTSAQPTAQKKATHPDRRCMVVVMDGLRPDSVTPEQMPALARFASQGTVFAQHHAVFVSSTEVNGTAIMTGGHPDSSGVIANREYRPEINDRGSIAIESETAVRKGDEVSGGHYLALPTVAEILRADLRKTAVFGTKPVALLLDRASERCEGDQSVVVSAGTVITKIPTTLPSALPKKADATSAANAAQDAWTTAQLLPLLKRDAGPVLAVLWLSEPDFAQHGSGPGSDVAKAALRSSDDCFARVLKALDDEGLRDNTDMLVVSDHGFSTISAAVDTPALLRAAGFNAVESFKDPPKRGDVLVVGNGGADSLYVIGHDKTIVQRLVDFLQTSDYAGTIFTHDALPGTFALTRAHIASGDAPDILFSLAWTDAVSQRGVAGMLVSEGTKRQPGQGTHASLSRFDMHNTLIAGGPDFRAGFVSELPSGNIDVAPTVLTLLGNADAARKMDGRVLVEALRESSEAPPTAQTTTLTTEPRTLAGRRWTQWLRMTTVGKAIYYDEGGAESKIVPP